MLDKAAVDPISRTGGSPTGVGGAYMANMNCSTELQSYLCEVD
jgi:hypothetical protein